MVPISAKTSSKAPYKSTVHQFGHQIKGFLSNVSAGRLQLTGGTLWKLVGLRPQLLLAPAPLQAAEASGVD